MCSPSWKLQILLLKISIYIGIDYFIGVVWHSWFCHWRLVTELSLQSPLPSPSPRDKLLFYGLYFLDAKQAWLEGEVMVSVFDKGGCLTGVLLSVLELLVRKAQSQQLCFHNEGKSWDQLHTTSKGIVLKGCLWRRWVSLTSFFSGSELVKSFLTTKLLISLELRLKITYLV